MTAGSLRGGSTKRPTAGPPGFSLVELVIALSLFSLVLAISLGFYRQQGRAFTEGNGRMTLMQNLRYGVNTLEENLRTAGVNVPARQPVLVYAGRDVLAFSADYATNIENDFFAVYHDARLPDDAVTALTPARRITIPNTSFGYPDAAYHLGSGNSTAETIIFYFEADAESARSDDYVLYRQVNDQEPEVVARRLLPTDGGFFTYYVVDGSGSGSPVQAIPADDLPLAHTEPIHGSVDDSGAAARVDDIRAVRVAYAATNGRTGTAETVREISRLIRLPNAGLASQPNCGNRPILGSTLIAQGVSPSGSVDGHIRLEWVRATDEHTGEQDVLRYVIWRRDGGSGPWGSPVASVSPGSSSYVHRDFDAEEGVAYSYALAAQDCTPQYSPVVTTSPVSWSD